MSAEGSAASRSRALEPTYDVGTGLWQSLWAEPDGTVHKAGLHPSRATALAVAQAVAAQHSAPRRGGRTRGPYKAWSRAVAPRLIPGKGYQGRYITFDGHDLLVPGYHDKPKDAHHAAEVAAVEYDQKRGRGRPGARYRLSHFLGSWPDRVGDDTIATHQERLGCFLRYTGYDPLIDDVTPEDLDEALDTLVDSGLSPKYIVQVMSSVSTLFARIVRQKKRYGIEVNPGRDVSMTKNQRRRARESRAAHQDDVVERTNGKTTWLAPRFGTRTPPHAVSCQDFRLAISCMPPDWAAFMKLLVSCGARSGEAPFLNRNDVDREAELIEIVDSQTRSGERVRGTKNTHDKPEPELGRMTICPRPVIDEVDAFGVPPDGCWLKAPRGGDINRNNFRNRVLKPAMAKAAALAGDSVSFLPWTLKDLRHTFATELIAAGIPFTHVSHWMGDSVSIDVDGVNYRIRSKVVDVYDHPNDTHVRRAAAVMAEYVGSGSPRLFADDGSA
jgi:integrase